MKKVLVSAATVALLMTGAAYAQNEPRFDIYATQDTSGKWMVTQNGATTELMQGENGAAPSNCPEGSYYSIQGSQGEEQIFACGNTDVTFGLFQPNEGDMLATGEALPENSFLLLDKSKETGDRKQAEQN